MNDLHTKYRPQTLDEVVGHTAVIKSIKDALAKKISRAFIFTGIRGVGKTTLARIIGKEVGCSASNIHEVNGAKNTGVEDMRKVLEGIGFSALGGGSKLYIIDEFHRISTQAMDSILKDTEEPPPNVYWVLCTTNVRRITDTMRSRFLVYTLNPIKADVIFKTLQEIADAEKFTTPDDVLDLIATKSGGSVRDAITGLAQCQACKTRKEAAELLRVASSDEGSNGLAAALIQGKLTWEKAMKMVAELDDGDVEGLRYGIVGYVTKVLQTSTEDEKAARGLNILRAFADPYPQPAGLGHLMLSIGEVLYSG